MQRIVALEFNPDQPRDEHGRWTGEGGGESEGQLLRDDADAEAQSLLFDRNPDYAHSQAHMEATKAALVNAVGADDAKSVDDWQRQMNPPAGTDEAVTSVVDQLGRPNEDVIYRGDGEKGAAEEVAARLEGQTVEMGISSFSTDPGQAFRFGSWEAERIGVEGRSASEVADMKPSDIAEHATVVRYEVAAGGAKTLPIENLSTETFWDEHEEVAAAQTYTVKDAQVGRLATGAAKGVIVTLEPK